MSCVKMNSTKVGYFGDTRSKVGGTITSYFYVLFTNQLNVFYYNYIFQETTILVYLENILTH